MRGRVTWRGPGRWAVAAALAIPVGCEHRGPIPGVVPDEAPVITRAPARPAWWLIEPRFDPDAGTLAVCAEAEDADLLTARRRALALATERFRSVADSGPVGPEILADSGRLPGGAFRAFVRLQAPATRPAGGVARKRPPENAASLGPGVAGP